MEVLRKMDKNTFVEYIKPALVLVIICFVSSFALSETYTITKPTIEKNAKIAADKARMVVMPKGDSFTEYTGKLNPAIFDYYIAKNKVGAAITASAPSYGGTIKVMVGVNADGTIEGVTVTSHADTPGLGTKAMTPEYLSIYKGKTINEVVPDKGSIGTDSIKKNTNLNAISGATVSSNGIYHSVQAALAQFEATGGVK